MKNKIRYEIWKIKNNVIYIIIKLKTKRINKYKTYTNFKTSYSTRGFKKNKRLEKSIISTNIFL